MLKELRISVQTAMVSHLPGVAIDSSEPAGEIISNIVQVAAETRTAQEPRARAVYVWRQCEGFKQYAGFEGETLIDYVEPSSISGMDVKALSEFKIGTHKDAVFSRESENGTIQALEQFRGANVPFALDFMEGFDSNLENRGAIFVLRDWHLYMTESGNDLLDRQLALFERIMNGETKATIVMLSPHHWNSSDSQGCPRLSPELAPFVYTISCPKPDTPERKRIIRGLAEQILRKGKDDPCEIDSVETLASATGGLTRHELQDLLIMSYSSRKNRFAVDYILKEKNKLIKKAGFNMGRPDEGFESIGGLSPLKNYLIPLRKRFTEEAREFGFTEYPRGLLMAGVPGCGKSAIAKALANEWGMNLVTVRATDLKGSLVGQSEAKVQRLLDTVQAAAPIIVMVDEAEKLLGRSDGAQDGGAHDAVLGQFLSFMQDDDKGVFFAFTANNMNKFPPELIDRFEGRFFIDLPSESERMEILRIHLHKRKQNVKDYDMPDLVKASKDFSGRNIEDAIKEAMTNAFHEDRPLTQDDLIGVFKETIPTSRSMKKDIDYMREKVKKGDMRKANDVEDSTTGASPDRAIGDRSFV